MAARDVLGPERVLPEIKGALALSSLQALTFAQARDVEHLARRTFNSLHDIVSPGKTPAGFGQRIDLRHTLPAPIAIAHALSVVLVHQLDRGARTGLDARGAGQTALLIFQQGTGDIVLSP